MKEKVIDLIYHLVEEKNDTLKEKICIDLSLKIPLLKVLPDIKKGIERSRFVDTVQNFMENPDSVNRDCLLMLADEIENKFEGN
jgi:GTP cyclohydrolase FolE2